MISRYFTLFLSAILPVTVGYSQSFGTQGSHTNKSGLCQDLGSEVHRFNDSLTNPWFAFEVGFVPIQNEILIRLPHGSCYHHFHFTHGLSLRQTIFSLEQNFNYQTAAIFSIFMHAVLHFIDEIHTKKLYHHFNSYEQHSDMLTPIYRSLGV